MRVQTASDPLGFDDDLVIAGENAGVLAALPEGVFDLIYMDPPFNTGRAQARQVSVGGGDLGWRPGRLRRPALPVATAAARWL